MATYKESGVDITEAKALQLAGNFVTKLKGGRYANDSAEWFTRALTEKGWPLLSSKTASKYRKCSKN